MSYRHLGPFVHPLSFIQNEQDLTKKDCHKYNSEWKFALNLPLIYENKCYSPSVKISMYAYIPMTWRYTYLPPGFPAFSEVNTVH